MSEQKNSNKKIILKKIKIIENKKFFPKDNDTKKKAIISANKYLKNKKEIL